MKISKWSTVFAVASIAMAFVVLPSMASASRLESKIGTLAPVGTKLTMKSENVYLNTYLGPEGGGSCEWSAFESLTKNDGKVVEGASSSPGSSVGCKNANNAINFTNIKFDNLTTYEPGVGTASLSFTEEIASPTPVICSWSGTGIPFGYALGSSSIWFTKAGGLKGPCGSGSLTATFNIKNNGSSIILN